MTTKRAAIMTATAALATAVCDAMDLPVEAGAERGWKMWSGGAVQSNVR